MSLTPHEAPESRSSCRNPIHQEAHGDLMTQPRLSEPDKKCDNTSPSIARGVEYLISELSRP